jgi:hypothetical protein
LGVVMLTGAIQWSRRIRAAFGSENCPQMRQRAPLPDVEAGMGAC